MLQRSPTAPGATSVRWRLVALGVALVAWASAGAAVALLVLTREPPEELAYWLMDGPGRKSARSISSVDGV